MISKSLFTQAFMLIRKDLVVGYCVDTVGMDAEMIRKYVKYQDDK